MARLAKRLAVLAVAGTLAATSLTGCGTINTDEERAAYYYEHTGKTWGDVNDYHMILDTSELGVENCADILMHYFEKLEYI